MTRRSILTLLGFSTLLKAAEGRDVKPLDAAREVPAAPLPVDAVRSASLLLHDVQSVLQELTAAMLAEINAIPEVKAAGLHFERSTYGSGSQWRPRPMSGINSELFTCVNVRRRRHPTSFAHLELRDGDGSMQLRLFTNWLPVKPINHPLWESCQFAPMMALNRRPTIQ